jgi:hypothetical protein
MELEADLSPLCRRLPGTVLPRPYTSSWYGAGTTLLTSWTIVNDSPRLGLSASQSVCAQWTWRHVWWLIELPAKYGMCLQIGRHKQQLQWRPCWWPVWNIVTPCTMLTLLKAPGRDRVRTNLASRDGSAEMLSLSELAASAAVASTNTAAVLICYLQHRRTARSSEKNWTTTFIWYQTDRVQNLKIRVGYAAWWTRKPPFIPFPPKNKENMSMRMTSRQF